MAQKRRNNRHRERFRGHSDDDIEDDTEQGRAPDPIGLGTRLLAAERRIREQVHWLAAADVKMNKITTLMEQCVEQCSAMGKFPTHLAAFDAIQSQFVTRLNTCEEKWSNRLTVVEVELTKTISRVDHILMSEVMTAGAQLTPDKLKQNQALTPFQSPPGIQRHLQPLVPPAMPSVPQEQSPQSFGPTGYTTAPTGNMTAPPAAVNIQSQPQFADPHRTQPMFNSQLPRSPGFGQPEVDNISSTERVGNSAGAFGHDSHTGPVPQQCDFGQGAAYNPLANPYSSASYGTPQSRPERGDNYTIDKKILTSLKTFDGRVENYKVWSDRVKDHCTGGNLNYNIVFELIEKSKQPIRWSALANATPSLPTANLQQVASQLWTFIGNNVSDLTHQRRSQLAVGEQFNGMELWRILYMENEGVARQVAVAGRSGWYSSPQCPNTTDVYTYVNQWNTMRVQYGIGVPDDHLVNMFHNILPAAIVTDLRKNRNLITLDDHIAEVLSDVGRHNDERLVKVHAKRLQNVLHPVSRTVSPVIGADMAPDQQAVVQEPTSMEAMMMKMEPLQQQLVAVVGANSSNHARSRSPSPSGSRNGGKPTRRPNNNRPDPKFKGCWECGEDHARAKCPIFQRRIKDNGGKPPRDDAGKWAKSIKKTVSMVGAYAGLLPDATESDEEFAETNMAWCNVLNGSSDKPPAPFRPVATSNAFEKLNGGHADASDDEEEMVRACASLTSNVTLQSQKVSQKTCRRQACNTLKAKVAAIAQDIRSGKMMLPDLTSESKEQFDMVWALVDTGAGANVACRKRHVPGAQVTKSRGPRLTTASGADPPSDGQMTIQSTTGEGHAMTTVFQDADVEMHILSGALLSNIGRSGSDISFHQNGGAITNKHSGQVSKFVKRQGVYFIQLKVSKSVTNTDNGQPFARPA